MDTESEYLTIERVADNCRGPWGLTFDRTKGVVYVADNGSGAVRKITEDKKVSVLPIQSTVGSPTCLAVTRDGNTLFFSDISAHSIKKIDLRSNAIQVISGIRHSGKLDGPFSIAQFAQPKGIVLDSSERNLYVCDAGNNCIRKLDLEHQLVSTIAGQKKGDSDGPFDKAEFNWPHGLAFDSKWNLYVADAIGDKIRYLDFTTRTVSTVFGSKRICRDGHADSALTYIPTGLLYDSFLNCLWFCDTSHKVRRYDIQRRYVSTIVGSSVKEKPHDWVVASFSKPISICLDSNRNMFISDHGNNLIWKLLYNRGRFWKYLRLLWIGHLKNAESCWFAKIPREMIREIARHFVAICIQ